MTTERNDTTIGCSTDTLKDFKEAKTEFMALIKKEVSDDYFIKALIKHFHNRFDLVMDVLEAIE